MENDINNKNNNKDQNFNEYISKFKILERLEEIEKKINILNKEPISEDEHSHDVIKQEIATVDQISLLSKKFQLFTDNYPKINMQISKIPEIETSSKKSQEEIF